VRSDGEHTGGGHVTDRPTPARAIRSIAGRHVSAVDLVTAEIRRAILTGALEPGQGFGIAELGEQLGVSHIPVREALRRLEGQGLIVLKPARRAVVAALTSTDLQGIYGLRLLIEPELAARAVAVHTAEQLDELASIVAGMAQEEPEVVWDLHQRFHLRIVEPAASEWDLRTLDQLWAAAERYTRLVFDFADATRGEQNRRVDVHQRICEAIRARDEAATRRAVRSHLRDNQNALLERIGAVEHRAPRSSKRSPA
jgi:DNA-binding GntR family transcriptional regulator